MQQATASSILCALCEIKFIPVTGNICPTCTIKSIEEIRMLQGDSINFCRYCGRYQRPPWTHCDRQSQEMMGILLKKTKGLNKVQFQSASFVWTEPHSKRIKLKVVFNRQVTDKMKLECTEVVQFVQKFTQCKDCKKNFTPHDWVAVVQVRQFASHKKTILNLQQIMLKQKISQKILKSQPAQNGIDVFFSSENNAQRLVDFLKSRFPTLVKHSKQLISHNQQNNTSTVKITFSAVIPKICKDDLVKIPIKLAKQLGSCSQVLYCRKVSSSLHFLDVTNFKKVQINTTQYFKYQGLIQIFTPKIYGRVFNILDSQDRDKETNNKYPIYDLTIMKQDQYKQLFTKCYFTDEPGRDVLGYDLTQIQSFQGVKNLPDYFMCQKIKSIQEKKKNKSKKRKQLARIRKQEENKISELNSQKNQEEDFQDQSEEEEWYDIQETQNIEEDQKTQEKIQQKKNQFRE